MSFNNPNHKHSVSAFIGLGSNLDQPIQQIQRAIAACKAHPNMTLLACSSLYGGKPLGPTDQPDYVNAVIKIATDLKPIALLDILQQQEQHQNRVKQRHWGERTIDLDVLLYGDEQIRSTRLTIPHAELCNRRFVIDPLLEIAPELILPDGRPLAAIQPAFDGDLIKIKPVKTEDTSQSN